MSSLLKKKKSPFLALRYKNVKVLLSLLPFWSFISGVIAGTASPWGLFTFSAPTPLQLMFMCINWMSPIPALLLSYCMAQRKYLNSFSLSSCGKMGIRIYLPQSCFEDEIKQCMWSTLAGVLSAKMLPPSSLLLLPPTFLPLENTFITWEILGKK